MELKKNPSSELKKDSTLYFTMGLAFVLLLVYIALESKVHQYPNEIISCSFTDDEFVENIQDELIEEVPITFQELPPPPPIILIVEEEIQIIDCDLPMPMDITNGIITCRALDVNEIDFEEEEEIPITCDWIFVEDVPIFPGCEDVEDKRVCFQEMMKKHIQNNLEYPKNAIDMNLQGKVFTQFTIQKDGSIGEVRMRGPYKILEEEAARIISKLPKMTPGKQRGTAVKVPFAIPIAFKLR